MKDTALGINSKSNDRFKDKSLCSEALFTVMFPPHAEHLDRKDPLNALFLYFKKLPGNVRDHMKRVFRSQQSLLEMFAADYKSDVYDALKGISQDHKKDFRLQQIDFTTQNPNEASWTDISDFPMVLIEILSFVLGHYSKESLQVCTYNILFIRWIQLLYHVVGTRGLRRFVRFHLDYYNPSGSACTCLSHLAFRTIFVHSAA